MSNGQHKWTKEDDIVAYYLYRAGADSFVLGTKEISRALGMTESSLKMRIANFMAIDTGHGLKNAAIASKELYDAYKDIPIEDHKEEFIKIVTET